MSIEEVQIGIGDHLRKIRKSRGMTIEDLSAISGLHRNHIRRIENGQVNAGIRSFISIAKALELPMCELFRFEETEQLNSPEDEK